MDIYTNNINQHELAEAISKYTNMKQRFVIKVGDFYIHHDGRVKCNYEDTGKEIEQMLKSKGLIKE